MPVHSELHGHGRAVLFTHGFGSSSHMFAGTAAVLAADHSVITWDLRGHGRSVLPEHPAEFTPEHCLDDITDLLDSSGADRAVLGGHSLGGYLSLAYAQQHPDRVAGLILVGTGPGFRNAAARTQWNQMAEGFAADLEAKGLDGLGGSPELNGDLHQGGAGGLILAARGILPQRDSAVIDRLGEVTAPALVVVGERDRPFLASSEYLAVKLAGAGGHLVVIPDCGHAPPITRPEPFHAAVRTFLTKHDL